MSDPVNHPRHYNVHPSGLEAIEICEHLSFCLGNAVKYVWRAGEKGDRIEDLRKAEWYLTRQMMVDGPTEWQGGNLVLPSMQDKLRRIWQDNPDFLGKFLWFLAARSLADALVLVQEEIKKAS
jgi:hypothetical protein